MSSSSFRTFDTLTDDQLALVNGVCDRFEQAWREGSAPSIQDFLAHAPCSLHGVLLRELVLMDASYRQKAGEPRDAETYRRLFPDIDLQWLAQILPTAGAQPPIDSTAGPPKLARYEILEEVGRGGMGVVYQARDKRLGRLVCLKSLHPKVWGQPDRLARLRREAQALSSLNHPNICTIYELEEQEGRPILVFEWVDGKTFREIARDDNCRSRLKELFLQTAKALAAAHRAGIVHRDIKPENLMVRSDGLVKVLDFGLARLEDSLPSPANEAQAETLEGVLLGTAKYMSPEQARGQKVTSASDVFSLGIVLYELATGRTPFSGGHLVAVLNAIVESEHEPAARVNVGIDVRLAALVDRMLEKRPEARPTLAEVIEQLEMVDVAHQEAQAASTVGFPVAGASFVGRKLELKELQKAFADAQQFRGKAVFISGEPGIGKTALLEGFVHALGRGGEALAVHGRCPPRLSVSDAYLPVLDALARAMDGPDGEFVRRCVESEAPAWRALTSSSSDALAKVLAESGSLSSGRLKREFRSLIDSLSATRVVVLFFDDLHWADDSTIDLLSYIGQELIQTRMLLLGAYRPTDATVSQSAFEQFRREFVARGWGSDLAIPFLNRDEVTLFLSRLFSAHRFSESLAEFLHLRTEGSPLFLHRLLQHMCDCGAISQGEAGWFVTEDLSAFDRVTPGSISGVIEAALARIGEGDRRLLQAASILGVDFDAVVVADTLGEDRAAVEDQLNLLFRQRGLIGAGEEKELPDGTLTHHHRFVHVLFQEALFGSLSPARRAAWSLKAAQVLAAIYTRRPEEVALDLAFLYETGRDFSQAIKCLQRAAQRDLKIGACREAASACQRGLTLIAKISPSHERDQQELALQFTCGFAESLARGYGSPESLRAYQRAEALCLRQPTGAESFSVHHGLWAYHLARMDAEKLLELGNRLVGFAEELESAPHRFAANTSFALTLLQQGELRKTQERLGLAESSGEYSIEDDRRFIQQMCMPFGPLFHCTRSWLCQLQGRSDEALTEAQKAAAWGEALGTPQFQVHSWYATLHYLRGDAAQALAWAGRMLEFARRTDFESYLRSGSVIEAWAAAELAGGGGTEAAESLEAALAMIRAQREMGIRSSTPALMVMIGEAQARLGKADEAQASFLESIAFGRESGERWWEAEALRQMGLLQERAFSNSVAAAERLREGLALAQFQGAEELERRCIADLGRLLS